MNTREVYRVRRVWNDNRWEAIVTGPRYAKEFGDLSAAYCHADRLNLCFEAGVESLREAISDSLLYGADTAFQSLHDGPERSAAEWLETLASLTTSH